MGESHVSGPLLVEGAVKAAGGLNIKAIVQELTVSGTVTVGVCSIELNHITVIVAAVIAVAPVNTLLIVKNTSASGIIAHTLTLTSGTFNGTNNIATLNAPNEALVVFFDSNGDGTVVENVDGVAFSST